jgi:hypothetical protein
VAAGAAFRLGNKEVQSSRFKVQRKGRGFVDVEP